VSDKLRVVICVPRKPDGGRRDDVWTFVWAWMHRHHPDWPIYEGTSDTDPWSMAAARNDAARQAGDWDVAVFQDSDTITRPDALEEAVYKAATSNKIWVAGDMRMTMDERSSNDILAQRFWFPRPDGHHSKDNCEPNTCYAEPASGSVVIGRPLFDAIGGYCEPLRAWGWEDLVFMTCAYIFGGGAAWVPSSMLLHFWHPRSRLTEDSYRNHQIWQDLHEISLLANKRELATTYLRQIGHQWPSTTTSAPASAPSSPS
jgi:hypothetical protein